MSASLNEMPPGWTARSLGDLVAEKVEQGEPTTEPVSYVDIGCIDRGTKQIVNPEPVTKATAPTRARQWLRRGDVLVSMTRPNLNAVALVTDQHDGAIASTGFDVLRASESSCLPEWIYYRVRSQAFVEDICRGLQGVVYPAVRPRDIRCHQLPVPSVEQQRSIVAAIESHFSRLDAATATLERVQRNLERYRASVLKAAVEGRLVPTEAELAKKEGRTYEPASVLLKRILAERRRRWEEAELAKLKAKGKAPTDDRWKAKYEEPAAPDTSDLPELPEGCCWTSVDAVGDVLLGRQRAPQYLTGRFFRPYLRVANIKDDRIDFSDVEQMDFDDEHFAKYCLKAGDILVSEGQSPELLGQSAIFRGGPEALCFQKTLHRFRPLRGGPSSEYAQLVFRSHVRNGVFMRLGSITTNIAHLTLEKFRVSPFPLAPQREQDRIVDSAGRQLSMTDVIDGEVSAQLARIARLRQSILKWAFEGRLVAPDDDGAAGAVARR